MTGDLVERLRAAMSDLEREAAECYRSPWPTHVLRTIQAHRRIVDLYAASVYRDDMMRGVMGKAPLAVATAAYRETVEALASIYFPEGTPTDG